MVLGTALNDRYDNANYRRCPTIDRSRKSVKAPYIVGHSLAESIKIWESMQYWGKIIGVAVALMMGGGFWGVVLGLLVGHMFDKARMRKMAWFANQRERQALFLPPLLR